MAHRHHHHHAGSRFLADPDRPPPVRVAIGRRRFLTDIGRGALAVTILGATTVACSSDDGGDNASEGTEPRGGSGRGSSTSAPKTEPVAWHRANLGIVSAYVLVRGSEAAIVDTGTAGSEPAISKTLSDLSVDWADVKHVMLTHSHPDHSGSVNEVLAQAEGATGYAGKADIAAISSTQTLKGVGDGDEVFGMQIIDTPGHTPGHISVLDPDGAFLVAGDALTADANGIAGPTARFAANLDQAHESVRKLAKLTFADALVGHGDPVEGDADTQVAALAATF